MKILAFVILITVFMLSVPNYSQTSITVTSTAKVIADADELIMEININNRGRSLDSLNIKHYLMVNNVLNALKKYNYKNENIYLIESNIGHNPEEVFLGSGSEVPSDEAVVYSAVQTYRILLSDFSIFENLKKDLIEQGAKSIRIINFGSSKYDEIKKSTYRKALDDAKAKAKLLYGISDESILKVKKIYDDTNTYSGEDLESFLTFEKVVKESAFVKADNRILTTITNAEVEVKVNIRVDFEVL